LTYSFLVVTLLYMKLKNDNGLFVDEETGSLVGYLYNFQGKGIFSPDGKVEVTPEQAETHNRLLSEAELNGLDENCQIGQRGAFYFVKGKVYTWKGTLVSEEVTIKGKQITFTRKGKVFTGRLQKDANLFNFRRVR